MEKFNTPKTHDILF